MNKVKIVATEYQDGKVVHVEEIMHYRCRYCAHDDSDDSETHEQYCCFNPAMRACATCHYNYTYSCPNRKPNHRPVLLTDQYQHCNEWIPEGDTKEVTEAIAYKLRGGKRKYNIYSMDVLFFKNRFINEI